MQAAPLLRSIRGPAKLKALAELLKGRIPVFGSGDLFSPEDAKQMLEETGCDGVMFARGAMGNPFIFDKTIRLLTEGKYEEIAPEKRIETGFKELERLIADIGEKSACREMRKRFCAYSKGMHGGAALRQQIVRAETLTDYKALLCSWMRSTPVSVSPAPSV